MKLGSKIGEGERSKIYNHSTDNDKIVKVTSDINEKRVAEYFFNNPSDLFVKIYDIQIVGKFYYIVSEKLNDVDFVSFRTHEGTNFYENKFERYSLKNAIMTGNVSSYIETVKSKVVNPEQIDEYYDFLISCFKNGMDIFDTAWNLGRKDGKYVCYDTQLL